MRRSGISSLILAAALAVPASAAAVQVVIADTAVTHTEAGGAYENIGAGSAPADFTAPNDYAVGTLYHRVTVTTAPTNGMTYRVCFVQGANTACSNNAISINGAGTFDANQPVSGFTNYGDITWNMPLDDIQVVAMDTAGVAVDATETTWIGNPDFSLYYPTSLTYQAVIVANGDQFEGYPGDLPGNSAEAPAISPNGGTFEGSVNVTLASGTADAMIYYTTDGTDPDNSSTLFDGTPITIDTPTTLRAITYADTFDPSPITSADFNIVAELSNGLRGRYYDSENFEGLTMTRTDPTIDFVFPDGSPPADIGGRYSILWSGQVTPRYTDTYTFKTLNDDGVRLWVNDQLVIDDWNLHGPEEHSGTVSLSADQPVSIWLEYFNGGGEGTIRLSWESPQQPEEVIPDTALVPNLPAGQTATVSLFGGDDIEVRETDAEPVTLQLRRRGAIDQNVSVTLAFAGTATSGTDYTIDSTTVQIPAGAFSANVQITIINDEEVEGDETIEVSIAAGSGYAVGSPSTALITILDDDIEVDSISGTITYTGTESGRIIVEAFRETDPVFAKRRVSLLNPGPYTISNLEEGDYTVIAYIDSDDDEQLDQDEIWGIYQGADLQPALVTIPPGQIGIDINLDVPPGESGEGDDDGGCCATISRRGDSHTAGWLALMLGAVVVALRRRRR